MASSTQKLDLEVELKCNAEKCWESIKNLVTMLPIASPDEYESTEVLEGDGVSAGSVFVVKHPPGHPIPSTTKKIELVDEEKKILCYSIIGGDLMKYYKNYKACIVVSPKGEGTLAKWCCEVNTRNEDVPNFDAMKNLVVKTSRDLKAHLLKA